MVGGAAFSMSHRRRQQATEYRIQQSRKSTQSRIIKTTLVGTDRGQKFELKLETRTTTMG